MGEGSFGTVYKGTFRGQKVAIKKMKNLENEGDQKKLIEEFDKEVGMLDKIQINLCHQLCWSSLSCKTYCNCDWMGRMWINQEFDWEMKTIIISLIFIVKTSTEIVWIVFVSFLFLCFLSQKNDSLRSFWKILQHSKANLYSTHNFWDEKKTNKDIFKKS